MFRKNNISYPSYAHVSAYQGMRNNSFLENFAYVVYGWSVIQNLLLYYYQESNVTSMVQNKYSSSRSKITLLDLFVLSLDHSCT